MKRAITAVATSLLVACAPAADEADTMSLGSVDTLKPATDSIAGTVGATTTVTPASTPRAPQSTATAAGQSKTGTKTDPKTGTKTGTKTAPVDTTNIGRDRAIPINTKDPKVRIPTVDTTKRPPS